MMGFETVTHTFRGRRETPWFGTGLHDSYVLEMVRPSETKGRKGDCKVRINHDSMGGSGTRLRASGAEMPKRSLDSPTAAPVTIIDKESPVCLDNGSKVYQVAV